MELLYFGREHYLSYNFILDHQGVATPMWGARGKLKEGKIFQSVLSYHDDFDKLSPSSILAKPNLGLSFFLIWLPPTPINPPRQDK